MAEAALRRTPLDDSPNDIRPRISSRTAAPFLALAFAAVAIWMLAPPAIGVDYIPAPTTFTDIAPGSFHIDAHLNATEVHWYRLLANSSFLWNGTVVGEGALGGAQPWVADVRDPTRVAWAFEGGAMNLGGPGWGGTLGFPLLSDSTWYIRVHLYTTAPNASDGMNYTLNGTLALQRELQPGIPSNGSAYLSVAPVSNGSVLPIWSITYWRLFAPVHSRVTVTGTLLVAPSVPAGGVPGFGLFAYMFGHPHGSYDEFPPTWNRFPAANGAVVLGARLNGTACAGNPCTTSIDFTAPYSGWYSIDLSALQGPEDLLVSVEASIAPNASLDGNDDVQDAVQVLHAPTFSGNLSFGLDVEDWFAVNLSAGSPLDITVRISDPDRSAGALVNTYELAVLTPDGRRLIASATTPQAGVPAGTLAMSVPGPLIDADGLYLVKLSVLFGGGALNSGTCTEVVCSAPYNNTLVSVATYTIDFGLPNFPPEVISPFSTPRGIEDVALTVDLSGLFHDPESDPLAFSVTAVPAGANASFSGQVLTFLPPPDANGNFSLWVRATDWFGAWADAQLNLSFSPAPDAPRANLSMAPLALMWAQASPSDRLSLRPYLYDPDGDPLVLDVNASGVLVAFGCGEMCVVVAGDDSLWGNISFSFTASDPGGLSVEFPALASIYPVNRRPIPLPPPYPWVNVTATADQQLLGGGFPYCTDPDFDPISVTVVAREPGAEVLTIVPLEAPPAPLVLVISSETEAGIGDWVITVACGDAGGYGLPFNVTVQVIAPNHRPFIAASNPPNASLIEAMENTSLNFEFWAVDPEDDLLRYVWTLDGFVVPGANNHTTVAFAFDAAGRHTLVANITDGHGHFLNLSWNIAVVDVDRPPVCGIEIDQNARAPAGELVSARSTSNDPDGDALAYRWAVNGSSVSETAVALFSRQVGLRALTLTVTARGATATCAMTLAGEAPAAPAGGAASADLSPLYLVLIAAAAAVAIVAFRARRARPPGPEPTP